MRASAYPLIDADEAAALVLQHSSVLGVERIELARSVGRVLAEDLIAESPLPAFPSSAVDGYAVRAADAGKTLRVVGESAAGRPFDSSLPAGTAARILTGGVVPDGADCIVMVEDVHVSGDTVTVPASLRAGGNFHRIGDDLREGDRILSAGAQLGAAELGIAAATGRAELPVRRRPRVALMSTGDELVEVGRTPGRGQIPDSNRWALLAALREAGADVDVLGIAPDEAEPLRRVVVDALKEADALVTSGGVSVGTHDLVKPLLESLGTVHVGRVKLKPGKPFTFATLADHRVAFGLPGFPVSSLVTFEVFVRPALRKMQGFAQLHRPTLAVRLAYDAKPTADRTEYQRVVLRREGRELVAETTGSQSSSRLMSLAGAHALVRIPAGDQGFKAGTVVEALILSLP
ncbi:MAG: molybdopterin molybdotransferase MoeA [Chloroflexi bacterium]|nr:MAG: molybdopterin molybdotransferase MoeA [Chloroflexota bacterium]TMG16424.1 MAG: molybdopterin molybdotransferase MoeA [Chloroflexota bacterium]